MADLLLPSLIATLLVTGALVFVCLYLWLQMKQRYLLFWIIGWSLYLVRHIFELGYEFNPNFINSGLRDCFAAFSMVFLLFGVLDVCKKVLSGYRWLWVITVINSIWSIIWNFHQNSAIAGFPTMITYGLVQAYMGTILLRRKSTNQFVSNRVLGYSMLLWGLHKLNYPVLRNIPEIAPFGFLLGSIFTITTMVFMLLFVVEQSNREKNISTERFGILFANTNDLILFFRLNGEIIDANRAAAEKYGYTKEELLGMTIFQLRGDEDRELLEQKIQEAEQKGISCEMEHYRKDGSRFTAEIHGIGATIGEERIIMCIIRDITERKQAEAAIRKLNYTDRLTSLYNRAYLEENLTEFDTEDHLPLTIVMGDVNGLKLVNDAFGHKTGDDLLKKIAQLLQESCRERDLVIRWGGDEFLILLFRADALFAEEFCRRIQRNCRETIHEPIQPSIALGYAVKESPSRNIHEVFKIADDRMYRNKLLESKSARNAIISSLQKTLFEKSYETEQHAERLKNLALKIGKRIGLPTNQLDDLALLATLHDVGKIGISEEILGKPGALSPEERKVMKKHPGIGHRIIKAIPDLTHIAEAILAHHERWDGTGYPQGLKEFEIPLISRIISIVDAYDAMINKRVYQEAISHQKALAEISRSAGSQFDPYLVEVFLEMFLYQTEASAAIDNQ